MFYRSYLFVFGEHMHIIECKETIVSLMRVVVSKFSKDISEASGAQAREVWCVRGVRADCVAMASQIKLAKRGFVKVLLQLAAAYGIALSVTRDSPPESIRAAYRKVSGKAHPDKCGSSEHQQALNAARDK